jgi:hypothetical protein
MSAPFQAAPAASRWLRWVGVGEAATLALLLANLATAHNRSLAQGIGPLHGLLYLAGIALVWTATRAPRARLLALVPGIGALLASRGIGERGPVPGSQSPEPPGLVTDEETAR